MKVSIITMHNYPNYGSVLQAFATQEKMKEFTNDVELIDYSGGANTVGRDMLTYIITDFRAKPIKALMRLPIRLWRRAVFDGFARQHMKLTADRYITEKDLTKFPIHNGIYATGSDQIWNPFFKENLPFFLNFIPKDKKKFAYAVSFGNYGEEQLRSDEIDRIKGYIEQYEHISVREERGLNFLRGQLGYQNAIQLVDPIVAMPSEFWRKLAPKPIIKNDYILLYKLGKEKEFELYANEISKRTGLPLVRICSQNLSQLIHGAGRKILLPPVFQFITLVDNAKYLITDSFHGVAFSMVLNTEPIIFRKKYDGERISGFLRLVGQERRYIKDANDFEILNHPTDFESVNKILARERERTDNFLDCVFAGNEGKNDANY